jgi:hypothetical protein
MKECRPSSIPVLLDPDNLILDVIVFPFATMLSSLLNCPMLNKIENLVVNPHDRFGCYKSPNGLLDKVNSAQWYQDTYDQQINDPSKAFLAPIIFTMDKTVISEASHLSVYVILFTTSIFNREVFSKLFQFSTTKHVFLTSLKLFFAFIRRTIKLLLGDLLLIFLTKICTIQKCNDKRCLLH